MSKQLKFRFKKTLKKADFVHADLEYHKELMPEAQKLFSETVENLVSCLSEEDQERLKKIGRHKQEIFEQQALQQVLERINKQKENILEKEVSLSGNEARALVPTVAEVTEEPQEQPEKRKLMELKKLFHRIAEQTHPDKVGTRGFSNKEVLRLEKVFKKALTAYNENNWYILYSIALNLELEIGGIDQEHIDWVEEDIRKTLSAIAQVGRLVAWVWYVGDEQSKARALKDYFQQMYGFVYPGL